MSTVFIHCWLFYTMSVQVTENRSPQHTLKLRLQGTLDGAYYYKQQFTMNVIPNYPQHDSINIVTENHATRKSQSSVFNRQRYTAQNNIHVKQLHNIPY